MTIMTATTPVHLRALQASKKGNNQLKRRYDVLIEEKGKDGMISGFESKGSDRLECHDEDRYKRTTTSTKTTTMKPAKANLAQRRTNVYN